MSECLFPEINLEFANEDLIVRQKTSEQSLGEYTKQYEEIMGVKIMEMTEESFAECPAPLKIVNRSENPKTEEFDFFRNYMFTKFPTKISSWSPAILLIQKENEIENIELLKSYLDNFYPSNYKCIIAEEMPLKERMAYFANAKIIIGAHKESLIYTLFCQPDTCIIQVDSNKTKSYKLFDSIPSNLKLKHLLCPNDLNQIKKALEIEFNARVPLW